MGYPMSDLGQRLRKSAPLLICVGMIFPWSVSPFGLQSCSVTTGSFLPESRSILRQWLPLEVKLDTRADHKEDPSKLEGLKGVKVYYFDPFVVLFVLSGFLLWGSCKQGGMLRPILIRSWISLIWFYLTIALGSIFYLHGDLWLQPGLVLVLVGYAVFTLAKAGELYGWALKTIRHRNFRHQKSKP